MLDHHLRIEVIQERQPFNKEYRIFRKSDGALRWIHDTGQLTFDKNGNVMFVIGTTQDITERKKAEKSIQSKNQRLNAIIQALPDLMFISDREGNYLEFFNPKSVDVFYPQEKMIGANVLDVYKLPIAQLHIQKIQECLDKKELISYEFSAKEDSEPVYFEGRMVPLDENRVLRVVRNITESKKLQQEQFRLLNIIESSLNEISVFDPETLRFSYVNQCGLSNLGYSLDEMKNLTPVDITVGYDWNTFTEKLVPLTSGQKQKLVFETIHKRKDGTSYQVEVHLQFHSQGKGKMFFAVVNDITNRKLAEASLRESEEMFRRLAESSPIAICIYQDSHWVYTNPAAEKIAGYTLKEYRQMHIWDFAAPEYQDMIKQSAELRMKGLASEMGYEFKIIRKDGESRWVYLRGSLISYKGRPAGLVTMLDMTEKKKMEADLILAKEKAEQSDKLKSAFLANMSHEIRTPLNSIIGFSELLADEAFDAEQKDEFIQRIVKNGNQLLTIISDILDISKIESGEITIRKTELQAKELLSEIRSLHILKVEGKLLHFRFKYPENITEITILADRERLYQIFNNLISNALKFTTEGYIELGCSVQGKMLQFHVKDTGIGIAPQNYSIIFDRFRQVDASMTRKFGGNGLGLAITKNLVELMGGKIWLESEPGKGSTFFFTIPLAHLQNPKI